MYVRVYVYVCVHVHGYGYWYGHVYVYAYVYVYVYVSSYPNSRLILLGNTLHVCMGVCVAMGCGSPMLPAMGVCACACSILLWR